MLADPSWAPLARLSTRSLGDPITMLNLNCYVRGDPKNCAFTVHSINEDKTVSNLRDAIKEVIRPKFDDIPANELVLWKNSVPINCDLKKTVEALNLNNVFFLQPLEILSNVFSDLVKNNIHIIIDRRLSGES